MANKQPWQDEWLDALFAYRLPQQLIVLLYKNVLVAWRSRRATLIRLLAPMMFLLLALVMQAALDASLAAEGRYRPIFKGVRQDAAAIPDCNHDLYIHDRLCVSLIFTPNTSAVVQDVVARIAANNQPPLPASKVRGFRNRADADAYMRSHSDSVMGAVHFVDGRNGKLDYLLQSSSQPKQFKSYVQDPQVFWQMPVMVAVTREIARQALIDTGRTEEAADLAWDPNFVRFPHPEMTTLSLTGRIIAPCIFAACMFGAVTQMAQIVSEKDSGVRQAMRTMGLMESSYWGSWVVFDLGFSVILALVVILSGMALQFKFFLANDFALLFALFWLFLAAISAFTYFATAFINKPQTAVYAGFIVFLAGWTFQGIVTYGLPYTPSFFYERDPSKRPIHKAIFWIFSAMPWNPLAKAILDMAAATNTHLHPGLRWDDRNSYCLATGQANPPAGYDPLSHWQDLNCVFPVGSCLVALAVQFVVYTILAVWLDNIVPNELGVSRHPLFFLNRSFWSPRPAEQSEALARLLAEGEARLAAEKKLAARRQLQISTAGGPDEDEDVGEESARIKYSLGKKLGGVVRVEESEWLGLGARHGRRPGAGAGAFAPSPSRAGLSRRRSSAGGNGGSSAAAIAAQAQAHAAAVAARQWAAANGGVGSPSHARGHNPYYAQHSGGHHGHAGHHHAAQHYPHSPSHSAHHHGHGRGHQGAHFQQHQHHHAPEPNYAVEVFGLRKVFRLSFWARHAPKWLGGRPGAKDFWAIKDSWFGIEQGSLFCLLGPNGAGKTTTINCLTGALPPTAGDALIYGQSLCGEGGLDRVRSLMGVCPQFDVLWNELSGREHLIIYGHIKGLRFSDVRCAAADLLERVKLTYAGRVRSSSYSGGMKRRLSVAIALLGDPKIVYLDEPTTGMDPISRRYVWDIIQEAKAGRAIVLTTHSMEEADILADRIAIMARGRLKAIGSSLRLKQKYGAGYTVVVSVLQPAAGDNSPDALAERSETVREFFLTRLGLLPFDEGRCLLHYLVPREHEARLGSALVELEAHRDAIGAMDVQVSLTSLEEVFLTIARKAELAAAQAQGKAEVEVPLPSGGVLLVALGQDRTVNPADGQTYGIKWAQDDAGRLVVLDVMPLGPGSPRLRNGAGSGSPAGGGSPRGGSALGTPRSRPPPAPPLPGAAEVAAAARAAAVAAAASGDTGSMRRPPSLTRLLASGIDVLLGARGSASAFDSSGGGSSSGSGSDGLGLAAGGHGHGHSSHGHAPHVVHGGGGGVGGGARWRGRSSSGGGAAVAAELGERGYRISGSGTSSPYSPSRYGRRYGPPPPGLR